VKEKSKRYSKTRQYKVLEMKKNTSTTCNNNVDSSNDDCCNNLKRRNKMEIQKPNLSKNKAIMSSNDLSDCSSKFSDSEVHYKKSRLSKNAKNIATISSDDENLEKSNDSEQRTDYNKEKEITKQINHTEIDQENQSIKSFETNNDIEEGILHFFYLD